MNRRTVSTCAIGTLAVFGTALAPQASSANSDVDRGQRTIHTVIKPGTLDRGVRPLALHMRNRRIYDGKRSFEARGPLGLDIVGKGDGGYLTVRYGSYHGHLWQIRPHRKARRLGSVPQAAYNGGDEYQISDAGNRLAITEPERSGSDMMWVRRLPSGNQLRFKWVQDGTSIVAFPKYRVLLANSEGTFWYAPKTSKRTRITTDTAIVVDRSRDRMVVRGDGDDRFELVEFDRPSRTIAGWQHGRPLAVSPDGKHVLAKVGKRRLQIRSLDDGDVVRTFSAAGRITTSSVGWESKRRVLFTAEGHRMAANVRCTIGGTCKRTSRLAERPRRLGFDWAW